MRVACLHVSLDTFYACKPGHITESTPYRAETELELKILRSRGLSNSNSGQTLKIGLRFPGFILVAWNVLNLRNF